MLSVSSPYRQARRNPYRQLVWFSVLLCIAAGGCYWLKYDKLTRTHVELLLSMADKMNTVFEDRQPITLSMVEEFSYPLERARDFARIVGQRYAEQQSLVAFDQFLNVYAELLREIDRLRVVEGDLAGFREQLIALRRHGARVEAMLDAEEQ